MITPELLYADGSLNVQLFHAINNVQDMLLQQIMLVGSMLGKYTMFPFYLIIIAAWQRKVAGVPKLRPILAPMVITYLIFVVWVSGLKHAMHMPRPFAILPEGSVNIMDSVRLNEEPFVSFPSGHASFSMMMLVMLWPLLNCYARAAGVAVLLWVGLSRISLGVHFPSDILTSWLVSFAITTLSMWLADKILKAAGQQTPAT